MHNGTRTRSCYTRKQDRTTRSMDITIYIYTQGESPENARCKTKCLTIFSVLAPPNIHAKTAAVGKDTRHELPDIFRDWGVPKNILGERLQYMFTMLNPLRAICACTTFPPSWYMHSIPIRHPDTHTHTHKDTLSPLNFKRASTHKGRRGMTDHV